ncbi:complement C1q tumor necrosis factor-related protein 3-like [Thunnus maccoyii]|uniref:complement C1q tumor necrosis factor-related protein 3-like n=1 Tax=Thunnus maccoyii TaxID=8240 RepID=UPI001C4B57EB|nr:complement C1q tumor necrosis factor-related protein 3-like [Thunnus maccoyii]
MFCFSWNEEIVKEKFQMTQIIMDPITKTADDKLNENRPYEPIPYDIHAALREMTASLAAQKVEMRQLQKDNEAQAEKLKELDKLKTEVDKQKTEVDKQKTEVDKVKQQLQARQVAFSAALLAEGSKMVGPFRRDTTLVFKYVATNIGRAYNSNSGIFTAPVRGAYHFEFYIGGYVDNHHPTAAVLVKNQDHVFSAYAKQTSYYASTSNGATLILEVGDHVFVRMYANTKMYDDHNRYCTFSGHLLFAM